MSTATATEAAAPVLSVRGLRKRYGDTVAVGGIDLDVLPGEVFALLGPNGAGKTTTIEILEGWRRRDGGDARVLDRDPARPSRAWRSRIGIVAQSVTDAPELTVEEVVRHFARYYPRPRDPAATIDLVGLTEKAQARVRVLAGGQQRRLDVALGIAGNPELLFLDEPTTGFAPEARRDFWQLVRLLSAEGTTILLTTHYLEEAEALAHRVGVIVNARIVAVGDPATLGGRAAGAATVSWETPEGRRSVETDAPAVLLAQLAREYGGEHGGDVPGLTVRRPTLEDVYLDLINQHGTEAR